MKDITLKQSTPIKTRAKQTFLLLKFYKKALIYM